MRGEINRLPGKSQLLRAGIEVSGMTRKTKTGLLPVAVLSGSELVADLPGD